MLSALDLRSSFTGRIWPTRWARGRSRSGVCHRAGASTLQVRSGISSRQCFLPVPIAPAHHRVRTIAASQLPSGIVSLPKPTAGGHSVMSFVQLHMRRAADMGHWASHQQERGDAVRAAGAWPLLAGHPHGAGAHRCASPPASPSPSVESMYSLSGRVSSLITVLGMSPQPIGGYQGKSGKATSGGCGGN